MSESVEWVLLSKYCTRKVSRKLFQEAGSFLPDAMALNRPPVPFTAILSQSSESVVMLTYGVAFP